MSIEKKIYIDYNFNKNQIKQVLLENSSYDVIPTPNIGEDKGLIYFDTVLNRILVWNGSDWKIVQYLDDRDLSNKEDIIVENIWIESNLIPMNGTGSATSSIVDYVIGAPMTYLSNSYSFRYPSDLDIISMNDYGSFYTPILKTYDGLTVSPGFNNWTLEFGEDFTQVTFYGGFSSTGSYVILPTNPPSLDYWAYTGRKGTFNFLGGNNNIITPIGFTSSIPILSPPNVRRDNITSITVNGVVIYEWTYDELTTTLNIDEASLGYIMDISDVIRIELNVY